MIRWYDRLIAGLATLAGLIIAAAGLLIIYDVIARNLGWQPPASTVALTEYAMLYFTMAAAPYLVRVRGHIVIEIAYQYVPVRARRLLDITILTLCAVVAAVMAGIAAVLLAEAARRGEIEIRSLDAPRWVLFLPLAVGFALMTTEFIRLMVRGEAVGEPERDRRPAL